MGSKLSPLLADVFLSDFEVDLTKEKLSPRIWRRYVDDVFAIIKERYLPQTLDLLNSKHETIKFTVEKEQNSTLPFLDLLITRKEDNTLKFGIYRKPTSTDRYIISESNHFGAQKQAAFHSMAHRLFNIPMEEMEFEAEKMKIHEAAKLNVNPFRPITYQFPPGSNLDAENPHQLLQAPTALMHQTTTLCRIERG
ncbi:uncharacterized protein LOC134222553 [Armigeres subalbatus]|uniref:uncharacterized protein LOC134222553 n=1 Tax=Armigeres subalbatus TaxID=124917 RepID=UPI002ED2D4B9